MDEETSWLKPIIIGLVITSQMAIITLGVFILSEIFSQIDDLRKDVDLLKGIQIEQGNLNADGTLKKK